MILASGKLAGDPAVVFPDLARRIARGSTVIFLTTELTPGVTNRPAGCR